MPENNYLRVCGIHGLSLTVCTLLNSNMNLDVNQKAHIPVRHIRVVSTNLSKLTWSLRKPMVSMFLASGIPSAIVRSPSVSPSRITFILCLLRSKYSGWCTATSCLLYVWMSSPLNPTSTSWTEQEDTITAKLNPHIYAWRYKPTCPVYLGQVKITGGQVNVQNTCP